MYFSILNLCWKDQNYRVSQTKRPFNIRSILYSEFKNSVGSNCRVDNYLKNWKFESNLWRRSPLIPCSFNFWLDNFFYSSNWQVSLKRRLGDHMVTIYTINKWDNWTYKKVARTTVRVGSMEISLSSCPDFFYWILSVNFIYTQILTKWLRIQLRTLACAQET